MDPRDRTAGTALARFAAAIEPRNTPGPGLGGSARAMPRQNHSQAILNSTVRAIQYSASSDSVVKAEKASSPVCLHCSKPRRPMWILTLSGHGM